LYVLSCPKTLKCDYFKTIFDDKPCDDTKIDVSIKQQYFIHGCHKICSSYMDNLYVQTFTYIKCSECAKENICDFSSYKKLMNVAMHIF